MACVVIAATIAASPVPRVPTPAAKASASPKPSSPVLSKYAQQRLNQYRNSAPADEYFGQLRLSFLGINNTLRDSAISSGEHTTDPAIVNKIAFAENALQDWEKKYPRDPQLARTYFLAINAEKRIWVKANQERAWTFMNRILSIFPGTFFAKQVKRDLDIGFTEHYYSDPEPCPTPTPTSTPSPTPAPTAVPVATLAPRRRGARPTPTPTAAPTATPTDSPTPQLTPTPVPTPRISEIAKGLRVQIEIPACVVPPTPSPSPTPIPTPTPAPEESPTPVSAPTTSPMPMKTPEPTPSPHG